MADKIPVILDARMVTEELHGIARYTYELAKRLSQEKSIQLSLLVNNITLAKSIFCDADPVSFIPMISEFLSPWEQVELPWILNRYKGKVLFHSPSFVSSPLIRCKTVMTIHDLNHIKFPEYYSAFHKYYYRWIVKPSARKSRRVLTVSKFSKGEIIEWLKCREQKVTVTYNGIEAAFQELSDTESLKKVQAKYDLPEKFLLYIGNSKPHKNVETLLKAVSHLKESVKLVLNGKPNAAYQEIIIKHHLQDKVQFIGYVQDLDLPALYNLAAVFVFPSFYEGFGLPPLEAMACGCPVIISDIPSLREVTGEAAVRFSPENHKELAEKIQEMLIRRKDPAEVRQSVKQAEKFNWDITVSKTLEVYKEVNAEKRAAAFMQGGWK